MRVKGPNGGDPLRSAEGVDEASATTGAAPTDGASSVDAGTAAGQVGGAAPVDGGADVIGEVSRRLKGGEISAREAVELLIDDAVERQVGRVTGDRGRLAEELRELLRKYSESDPYLAAKVRRLGSR